MRLVLMALPVLALIGLEAAARAYHFFRYGVPGHSYGTSKFDPVLGAVPREYS